MMMPDDAFFVAVDLDVTVFASLEVREWSVSWWAVSPTKSAFLRSAALSSTDFWHEKGSDALTLDLEARVPLLFRQHQNLS